MQQSATDKYTGKVTSIGKMAFYNCTSLTNVDSLPERLTKIEDYMFYKCSSLESIEIPNSVTSIGKRAFVDCKKLSYIEIPSSVTTISEYAFAGSTLTEISFSEGLETIEKYAFNKCNKLTDVSFPKSLKNIKAYAFYYCSNLKVVTFASDDVVIEDHAFSDLINQYIDTESKKPSCKKFGKCGDNISWKIDYENRLYVEGSGRMYNYERLKTPWTLDDVIKEVYISDGITYIGSYAFADLSNVTTLNLPDSVTGIGSYAFASGGFTSFEIPEAITSIASGMFNDCQYIKELKLPESITMIGSSAFGNCRGLEKVNLPNSITSIGDAAFSNCVSLTEIKLPNYANIRYGEEVFKGCSNLKSVISYSGSNKFGTGMFENCSSLESVPNIPSKTIPARCFKNCTSLTKLKRYIYETIGKEAFMGCTSLESITFYDYLKVIDTSAFSDCTALKYISFLGDPPSIGSNIFSNVCAVAYYDGADSDWTGEKREKIGSGGAIVWQDNGPVLDTYNEIAVYNESAKDHNQNNNKKDKIQVADDLSFTLTLALPEGVEPDIQASDWVTDSDKVTLYYEEDFGDFPSEALEVCNLGSSKIYNDLCIYTVKITGFARKTGKVTVTCNLSEEVQKYLAVKSKSVQFTVDKGEYRPSRYGWGLGNKGGELKKEEWNVMFDDNNLNNLVYEQAAKDSLIGFCSGFAYTSALTYMDHPNVETWFENLTIDKYSSYLPWYIKTLETSSTSFYDLSLKKYIHSVYCFQYSKTVQEEIVKNANQYENLFSKVENFEKTGTEPICIHEKGWKGISIY